MPCRRAEESSASCRRAASVTAFPDGRRKVLRNETARDAHELDIAAGCASSDRGETVRPNALMARSGSSFVPPAGSGLPAADSARRLLDYRRAALYPGAVVRPVVADKTWWEADYFPSAGVGGWWGGSCHSRRCVCVTIIEHISVTRNITSLRMSKRARRRV